MPLRKFKHDLTNSYFQEAVENDLLLLSGKSMLTFSQTCQDLFVVAMLEGKSFGTFLEIGCSQPKYSNNTYILDKIFQFTGVSIDLHYDEFWPYNQQLSMAERSWHLCRPAIIWHKADALCFDYSTLPDYFDYLQIDIDPAKSNLELLEKLCITKKFAVITFEHDDWNPESSELDIKQRSRNFLLSKGYQLVAGDVGVLQESKLVSYEDWWAHPDFVKQQVIDAYKFTQLEPSHCNQVLFADIK
jgi:hypothetical protein